VSLEIHAVDPFDDALHDRWHRAYAAATLHDRDPDADPWTLEESRAELQQPSDVVLRRAFVALEGDEVVAAASLTLPLKDNRHRAEAGLFVRPEVRSITTYNAESNVHMVGVNDALDFRPVERLGEFQKRLV